MQDRLGFRVWDGKTYKHDWDRYYLDSGGCLQESSYCGENIYLESSTNIIEQCTGLKDSKGNLIYEGDIIKYESNSGGYVFYKIYYNEDLAQFKAKSPTHLVDCVIDSKWLTSKEIVGNIHEHEGLLRC